MSPPPHLVHFAAEDLHRCLNRRVDQRVLGQLRIRLRRWRSPRFHVSVTALFGLYDNARRPFEESCRKLGDLSHVIGAGEIVVVEATRRP